MIQLHGGSNFKPDQNYVFCFPGMYEVQNSLIPTLIRLSVSQLVGHTQVSMFLFERTNKAAIRATLCIDIDNCQFVINHMSYNGSIIGLLKFMYRHRFLISRQIVLPMMI